MPILTVQAEADEQDLAEQEQRAQSGQAEGSPTPGQLEEVLQG